MIKRTELIQYCNELLEIDRFKDYCPNGLQVEGTNDIANIVTGVTASQALIDAAASLKADVLLVHHGFFWKGENSVITGMKQRRIKTLLTHDMNLLAYHLPLDAHQVLGNNILLANKLGLEVEQFFANDIAVIGRLKSGATVSGEALAQMIQELTGREPLHVAVDKTIARLAICTGAAQSYIEQAMEAGADAFISGEISENTWHFARENDLHYFAAGHHATERYGVQALGEHLAAHFGLNHEFIDIYNPV
jgi:dinuclear metal center YbgI/SA1388 family protein